MTSDSDDDFKKINRKKKSKCCKLGRKTLKLISTLTIIVALIHLVIDLMMTFGDHTMQGVAALFVHLPYWIVIYQIIKWGKNDTHYSRHGVAKGFIIVLVVHALYCIIVMLLVWYNWDSEYVKNIKIAGVKKDKKNEDTDLE